MLAKRDHLIHNNSVIKMKLLVFLSALCFPISDCAHILAVLPTTVKSHWVVMEPLLSALSSRGHHLTVYSNFGGNHASENFTHIDCSDSMHIYVNNVNYSLITAKMSNVWEAGKHMLTFTLDDCETVFKSKKFDLTNFEKDKYDLVITEMFSGNCFVHFAYKLNAPFLSIVTSVPLPWTVDYFGIPDNPAYIPNYFLNFHPQMTLPERIYNTVILLCTKALFRWYANPRAQRIAEDYFKERLPWVSDVARQSSLLLVNSHFSLSQSRPLPPNVVEVGGIHIKEPQPLPEDIQHILDESPQGVILLSFGTMIRVSTISPEKIQAILHVFANIPQTVLMKYEEELANIPHNVVIRSWLPQRDILAHPNLVAVVSHGGLASVMEAVWSGVPLLGVPLFADQFLNINQVVWKGAGILVQLDTLDERNFQTAVDQVINNSTYKENMHRLSILFRKRPLGPLESAVYWTEYVIRHQGATHLRPVSTSLATYQLLLLDVTAVLIGVMWIIVFVLWKIVKAFRRMVRKSKDKELKKRQ